MASEARLRANRANAQRSTGPRTAQGKARSSCNALKHGLSGSMVVLPSEDYAAFQELRGSLFTEYDPQSPSEAYLVDQLSQQMWRMNRTRRYETGTLGGLEPGANGKPPSYEDLDHLRRYEAAISRDFFRYYDRLQKILAKRPAPEPCEEEETTEDTSVGFVSQRTTETVAQPVRSLLTPDFLGSPIETTATILGRIEREKSSGPNDPAA